MNKPGICKSVFFILLSIFALLLILAPFSQPPDTINDMSGAVGRIDNSNTTSNMSFQWNWIYAFGDWWCHQKSSRSFFINENQMPVCARCIGIFFGLPLGILGALFIRMSIADENFYKKLLLILAIGFIPTAIDGGGQLIGLWESTNAGRVITGMLTGFAGGALFAVLIDALNLIAPALKNGARIK